MFIKFSKCNSIELYFIKNQECRVRPKIADVNSNNPIFYTFSIKINKCSGNWNNINNPYAKIFVPDTVKDLNVRVFNMMSRTNETRHINCMKLVSAYVD